MSDGVAHDRPEADAVIIRDSGEGASLAKPSCVGLASAEGATQAVAPSLARLPPHRRRRARLENTPQTAAAAGAERPTWGLVETLDIMADGELMDQLAESERDRLAGRVVRLEDFLSKVEIEDKKRRRAGGQGRATSANECEGYEECPAKRREGDHLKERKRVDRFCSTRLNLN